MNNTLTITNLHAGTKNGIKILNGISLKARVGEIHAIMGPNGSGKSTFAQVLMGNPAYLISKGKIKINSKDITNTKPNERAKHGLFLAFQEPIEISGINFASYLRMAVNENSKKNEEKISPITFRNFLLEKTKKLSLKEDILKRNLNEGFSGGEKKKTEILQMALLKPNFAILDEPDSGLDIDGLKFISKLITSFDYPHGLIIITHYQRIFRYIQPDFVHILSEGKIVKTGDYSLVQSIEKQGYKQFLSK